MARGVIAGSPETDRLVDYITKYLTKHAADCHDTTGGRQRAHLERMWQELRHTPCTPRCPNWLLYGVQPKGAQAKMMPGRCRGRVHQRATLGLGGRRVLVSRQWSGKTLADHRYDTRAWVRQLLGVTAGMDAGEEDQAGSASRYAWEKARPTDPDVSPLGHRLLRKVSESIQLRNRIAQEQMATGPPAPETDVSATPTTNTDTPLTASAALVGDHKPNRVGRGGSPGGRRVGAGGKAHTDRSRPATTVVRRRRTVPAVDEAARRSAMAAVLLPEMEARTDAVVAAAPAMPDEVRLRLAFLFRDRFSGQAAAGVAGSGDGAS
jgi:hypothetical protein